MLTKRRTREHVIADLSRNHVERIVLRAGFTVERFANDYGLDLMLRTFDLEGRTEPGNVYFQLKATDNLENMRRGDALAMPLDARDLRLWWREIHPVVLIVYDARKDRAYWQHVQSYIRVEWKGEIPEMALFRTVKLPIKNILSKSALLKFADQKRMLYESLHKE